MYVPLAKARGHPALLFGGGAVPERALLSTL